MFASTQRAVPAPAPHHHHHKLLVKVVKNQLSQIRIFLAIVASFPLLPA